MSPETGLPRPSYTYTLGAVATGVPATAVCPLPPATTIVSAPSPDVVARTVVALSETNEAPDAVTAPRAVVTTASASSNCSRRPMARRLPPENRSLTA